MTTGADMVPALSDDALAVIAGDAEPLDRGLIGASRMVAALARDGLLAAPLPVALGGQGWGVSTGCAAPMLSLLMALGGASLPLTRLYEGHVNALRLIMRHGSDAQRARVAALVCDGALLGVWGADGSDPVTIQPGGGVTGIKAFASGLGDVALAVVTARTVNPDGVAPSGPQMLLLPASDAVRWTTKAWDMAAMVGTRSGRFDATGFTADADTLLGRAGAMLLEPDFHGGIWRLVAAYAGAMDRLARDLSAALEARGLADDPLMRHRLGEAAMEAHGARLWATDACEAAEPPGGVAPADPGPAIARVLLAREAVEAGAGRLLAQLERALGTAIHAHGSATGRMMRDLRLFMRQAALDGKLAYATQLWRAGPMV